MVAVKNVTFEYGGKFGTPACSKVKRSPLRTTALPSSRISNYRNINPLHHNHIPLNSVVKFLSAIKLAPDEDFVLNFERINNTR
jgi:hypothetical protein